MASIMKTVGLREIQAMTIERESILNKIRALLAKTMDAGCTEEEALSALGKAQAMKDAYAITEAELNLTKEEKAILRSEPPGTKDPHLIKWQLLIGIEKFCNVKSWKKGKAKGGGLVFCGLPADVQFATWLLDSLTGFVQAELFKFLVEAAPSNEDRKEAIRGFVFGCTQRVEERLEELCKQSETHASSNSRALVVVKNAAIKAKMDELDIHLRGGGCCGGGDPASYLAGSAAGNRASFGRPVSGRNATLRLR
jgi:Protein of unknown function (DUF2786)